MGRNLRLVKKSVQPVPSQSVPSPRHVCPRGNPMLTTLSAIIMKLLAGVNTVEVMDTSKHPILKGTLHGPGTVPRAPSNSATSMPRTVKKGSGQQRQVRCTFALWRHSANTIVIMVSAMIVPRHVVWGHL
jgi:hypothetical protein